MNINKYTKQEQRQIRAMLLERKQQEQELRRAEPFTGNTYHIGDFFKVEGNKIVGGMNRW